MSKPVEQVKKFIEVLQDAGYDPKPYSGRGMYGKSCVSLKSGGEEDEIVSAWEVAKAIYYYREDDYIDIPEPRQDSMGLGVVLYWPRYEWPSEDDNAS